MGSIKSIFLNISNFHQLKRGAICTPVKEIMHFSLVKSLVHSKVSIENLFCTVLMVSPGQVVEEVRQYDSFLAFYSATNISGKKVKLGYYNTN